MVVEGSLLELKKAPHNRIKLRAEYLTKKGKEKERNLPDS